jgi:AraC-like DNA-binding protein
VLHPNSEAPVGAAEHIVERWVAERVLAYVEANYCADISLRDVAHDLGYSAAHLTNTFRRQTGIPVTAWIIKRRILAAQELLRGENATVASVCEHVGFNDLCYFTRQFVRHVGITPGRYRAAETPGP